MFANCFSLYIIDAVNWPPFIRTTALIDSPPKATRRIFEWASFDETQRHIDPYYESSKLYLELEPSVHLIRKVRIEMLTDTP